MPKKEFPEDGEETLETSGLHPRAMLQIREIKKAEDN
jgi:hypothetical protein